MADEKMIPLAEEAPGSREKLKRVRARRADRERHSSRNVVDSLLDLRDSVLRGRRRMFAEVLDVISDTADSVDRDDENNEGRGTRNRDRYDRARERAAEGIADLADSVDRAADSIRSHRRD